MVNSCKMSVNFGYALDNNNNYHDSHIIRLMNLIIIIINICWDGNENSENENEIKS